MGDLLFESAAQQLAAVLLGTVLIGMLARWIGIPYAVALVLVGVALGASPLPTPLLDPHLVLFLLLPPLLFDAAFRLDAREARQFLRPILLLAVPGVLVSAGLVGGVLSLLVGLPLAVGLLFGSVVAATDPVAVIAVFQRLGVSGTVGMIAEGESLINDATAITLYTILLGLVLTGTTGVAANAALFGWEVLGGLIIGGGLGWLAGQIARRMDDHLLEMVLSMSLAYGSYLLAQAGHASGPLACVVAGVIHGTYGRALGMSESTSQLLDDLWEYLGFLANTAIFLLVGVTVNLHALLLHWVPVCLAIGAVVLARAVFIGLAGVVIPKDRLLTTGAEQIVLIWGGLRGAVTIALALALPQEVLDRDLLIAMAFGVVLFTLVVQGLTLPAVIRRLGLAR